MAAENRLRAKENRRRVPAEGSVDYIFLILVLLALTVGLTMLYSASSAQSRYDTGYRSATRYLQKPPSAGSPQASGIGWPGRCMG